MSWCQSAEACILFPVRLGLKWAHFSVLKLKICFILAVAIDRTPVSSLQ